MLISKQIYHIIEVKLVKDYKLILILIHLVVTINGIHFNNKNMQMIKQNRINIKILMIIQINNNLTVILIINQMIMYLIKNKNKKMIKQNKNKKLKLNQKIKKIWKQKQKLIKKIKKIHKIKKKLEI